MERWAAGKYAGKAHFVCVGCAGAQLAQQMGSRMGLKHAVNAYIADEASMPRWGQLGCNGLIVLDAQLQIVNPCTAAYLQLQGAAFSDLERTLDAELGSACTISEEVRSDPPASSLERPLCPLQPLESVNEEEMDAEHQLCVDALNALLNLRTLKSLEKVASNLGSHFQSEEKMLDEGLYRDCSTANQGGFSATASARKSHFADHQRMLNSIQAELAKQCEPITEMFIGNLLGDFEGHATNYDSQYANV